jgi:uncharacterized protein (DUF362 family)
MEGGVMTRSISRRSFLKKGAAVAGGILCGGALPFSRIYGVTPPDIFVVHGSNYFENTITAVQGLGGIKRMVSRGSKVGLLVNHAFLNLGAHVHPDMTVAVARMCFDAGAESVTQIKSPPWGYFDRARRGNQAEDVIRRMQKPSGDYKTVPVRRGVALKEARIMKDLLECDVFINAAIIKDHSATYISAALKNMMGSAPFATNRKFHKGGFSGGDEFHLAQCIADINLVRRPDLVVMDATEVLASGGPHGPGLIKKPHKVFAGRDLVAMDTYGTRLMGVDPEKIKMLDFAARHGLGKNDLGKVRIKEIDE